MAKEERREINRKWRKDGDGGESSIKQGEKKVRKEKISTEMKESERIWRKERDGGMKGALSPSVSPFLPFLSLHPSPLFFFPLYLPFSLFLSLASSSSPFFLHSFLLSNPCFPPTLLSISLPLIVFFPYCHLHFPLLSSSSPSLHPSFTLLFLLIIQILANVIFFPFVLPCFFSSFFFHFLYFHTSFLSFLLFCFSFHNFFSLFFLQFLFFCVCVSSFFLFFILLSPSLPSLPPLISLSLF